MYGEMMIDPNPAHPKICVAMLALTWFCKGIVSFITVKIRLQYMLMTLTVDIWIKDVKHIMVRLVLKFMEPNSDSQYGVLDLDLTLTWDLSDESIY